MQREPRETKIETYLHDEVERVGATTRKWASPGRRNVMDRIVIWPGSVARIHFVECKRPKKTMRSGQEREGERLRKLGCTVLTLDTKARIDSYVRVFKCGKVLT